MKTDIAERIKATQMTGNESRVTRVKREKVNNSWMLGLAVSTCMIFLPPFAVPFLKTDLLFIDALRDVLVGRDIVMLAISTIVSLLSIKAWVRTVYTRNWAIAGVICCAFLHGVFSVADYLGALEREWKLIIVNLAVILLTVYIIYLGYRREHS